MDESPWGWVIGGVVVSAIALGLTVLGLPWWLWLPAAWAGGVFTLIGCVGVGVLLGMSRARR